jgi:hypothetical protein
MKFVITGDTRTPRGELYATGINAGPTPMNSVSAKTSLLVRNDPNLLTMRGIPGAEQATPVVTEERFRSLLRAVQPGIQISGRSTVRITTSTAGGAGPAQGLPGARWSAPGLHPGLR